MTQLVIRLRQPVAGPCGLCGQDLASSLDRAGSGAMPQLALAADGTAVCRDCGKRHAPELASLVDLARAAEEIGRISRQGSRLPMERLLELATVAENYTLAAAGGRKAA